MDSKVQRSPVDVFEENQPISFFLTKVAGIEEKFNRSHAMNLKGIFLSLTRNTFDKKVGKNKLRFTHILNPSSLCIYFILFVLMNSS